MHLVILRRVSSACIYLNIVCHNLSKIRVGQTFNLYCTLVQGEICRCMALFLGEEYILIRSKRIVLKRPPNQINNFMEMVHPHHKFLF